MPSLVAPRRGAWIETDEEGKVMLPQRVAPRRGAWIETLEEAQQIARDAGSHPAGVRGLKHVLFSQIARAVQVAPRRGAWIET